MIPEKMIEAVEKLVTQAAAAEDSADAMRFSQAAANAANALITLVEAKRKPA